MALHYDLTQITNRAANYPPTKEGRLNSMTEQLIFMTMSVGIGEITEKTAGEFFARTTVVAHLHDLDPVSMRDVIGHIGLKTNVFPMETRAQWLKRYVGQELDRSKRWFEQHRNEITEVQS